MLPEVSYWARIKGAGYHAWMLAGEQPLETARQALSAAVRATNPGPWLEGHDGIGAVIGDGRLEAVLALGETRDEAVRDRLAPFMAIGRLGVEQRNLLLHGGDAADRGGEICACFGVSCAAVETAIADGAATLDAIGAITRAGTNCGSCRPEIRALLRARAPESGQAGGLMQSFPLFLTLQDRHVLVVGGTEAAARKVELLLSAGARVTLIADTVVGEIAQLIADGPHFLGRPRLRRGRSRRRVAGDRRHRRRGPAGARVACRPAALRAGECRRSAASLELHHAGDRRSRADHHRHLDRRCGARAGAPAAGRDRTRPAGGDRPGGALRRDLPRAGPPHPRSAARAAPLLGPRLRRPHRRDGAGRRRDRRAARADPPARQRPPRDRPARSAWCIWWAPVPAIPIS